MSNSNPIMRVFNQMAKNDAHPALRATAFLDSVNDMGAAMGLSDRQIENARHALRRVGGLEPAVVSR